MGALSYVLVLMLVHGVAHLENKNTTNNSISYFVKAREIREAPSCNKVVSSSSADRYEPLRKEPGREFGWPNYERLNLKTSGFETEFTHRMTTDHINLISLPLVILFYIALGGAPNCNARLVQCPVDAEYCTYPYGIPRNPNTPVVVPVPNHPSPPPPVVVAEPNNPTPVVQEPENPGQKGFLSRHAHGDHSSLFRLDLHKVVLIHIRMDPMVEPGSQNWRLRQLRKWNCDAAAVES
ncbi:hypothetical protein ACH5RR_016554 [Cinchona calisaya]|uniref:Uncharacterized protein n=1 Tax=Cinchona calisaya TaxID=153742 RepID=A0ABD2ZZF6_9GENT